LNLDYTQVRQFQPFGCSGDFSGHGREYLTPILAHGESIAKQSLRDCVGAEIGRRSNGDEPYLGATSLAASLLRRNFRVQTIWFALRRRYSWKLRKKILLFTYGLRFGNITAHLTNRDGLLQFSSRSGGGQTIQQTMLFGCDTRILRRQYRTLGLQERSAQFRTEYWKLRGTRGWVTVKPSIPRRVQPSTTVQMTKLIWRAIITPSLEQSRPSAPASGVSFVSHPDFD